VGRTFEEHLLDTNVIVKPLDVPQPRYCASEMAVERWRAVS
jgi:isocitrate dehydrogenase kinase/phosphatase